MFMLDSLVMILLVFMGLRDDRRSPDDPPTSLFRTCDGSAPVKRAEARASEWTWDAPGPGAAE